MLITLKKSDYHLVKELVADDYLSIQLESVINGKNKGAVIVDSETPTTAMVYHQGENGYYFIGDPTNKSFLKKINDNRKKLIKDYSKYSFEFSGDSPKWEASFKQVFDIPKGQQGLQRIYLGSHREIVLKQDSFYRIEKISPDHFDADQYVNTNYLINTINNWWHSLDDYLRSSIGYVAIKDNKIIGRCVLDGYAGQHMAIGIAVEELYRNKGIASSLASHTIKDIYESGCKVYWECDNTNKGSIALAEKFALEHISSYKLFWL